MKSVYMYPWSNQSKGALLLGKALGIKLIRRTNSRFEGSESKTVINWGCTRLSREVSICKIVNKPGTVQTASNKKDFFAVQQKAGVNVPESTDDPREAMRWVEEGNEVMARCVLNGKGGEGILFYSAANAAEFLRAPLFTKYIKKKHEFRIHVMDGKVFDVQQKRLLKTDEHGHPIDSTTVDFRVRNLANGFIFARNDVEIPKVVEDEALKAMKACGLDFGGVDVIYNEKQQKAYILEINTAPGLMGSTIDSYVTAFKDMLG